MYTVLEIICITRLTEKRRVCLYGREYGGWMYSIVRGYLRNVNGAIQENGKDRVLILSLLPSLNLSCFLTLSVCAGIHIVSLCELVVYNSCHRKTPLTHGEPGTLHCVDLQSELP